HIISDNLDRGFEVICTHSLAIISRVLPTPFAPPSPREHLSLHPELHDDSWIFITPPPEME
ncbi:hypothetical protein ACVBEG_26905, partial [Pseudomonas sp. GG8]